MHSRQFASWLIPKWIPSAKLEPSGRPYNWISATWWRRCISIYMKTTLKPLHGSLYETVLWKALQAKINGVCWKHCHNLLKHDFIGNVFGLWSSSIRVWIWCRFHLLCAMCIFLPDNNFLSNSLINHHAIVFPELKMSL